MKEVKYETPWEPTVYDFINALGYLQLHCNVIRTSSTMWMIHITDMPILTPSADAHGEEIGV